MAEDAKGARDDMQAMVAAYLARGGTITVCPPGPSENVVFRHRRPGARPKARQAAKPAAGEG